MTTTNHNRPLRLKSPHISPIETGYSNCNDEEAESMEGSSSSQKHRKAFRQNTFSWSSTSSSFSLSSTSTLSSIPTPVTAITTTTPLAAMEEDALPSLLSIFDDEEDEDEDIDSDAAKNGDTTSDQHESHEQQHQRRWRRKVTKALSRASSNGDALTVRRILTDERLRPFLNIDASDDEQDGTTPLIYAACFGKADVVQILLNAGAKVDVQDKRGWTALMWATTNNYHPVVEILLEHGASFTTRSARGRTAVDFIDSENTNMVNIVQHRDSIPSASCSTIQRRLSRVRPPNNNNMALPHDNIDFYYQSTPESYNDFMVEESERHRKLLEEVEEEAEADESVDSSGKGNENELDPSENNDDEDEELATCEANMRSLHKFIWDQCLPDQMFVFSEDDIDHILDTAIVNLRLPMKSRQEIWVPANIIFLSARFAHYYLSRDILNNFLRSAVNRVASVINDNRRDIHTLAFWMANLSQLLYYLKKDTGLVVATAEHQLEISEWVSETYTLLVSDSEERIDKILEPAILEHEQITGLEQIDFADDWHRFFRRKSTRKSIVAGQLEQNTQKEIHSPRTLTPQSITNLLSSILYVLQSYEVHPTIVIQAIAQFFHFLSCEIFNRMLTNKKYMCRSKALQIRMNLTVLEEWIRDNQLPANLSSYLNPLIQLLQLLQCVSQLNELELFINTMKTFDLLNPLQIKRCVLNYRYEVTEQKLPEEIEKYSMQLAEDTIRSLQPRTQRPSCDSCLSNPKSRRESLAARGQSNSRPTSVSSLGSLLFYSISPKEKRLSLRSSGDVSNTSDDIAADAIEEDLQKSDDNEREWVVEKRDSKYMLPFSLPTTTKMTGWHHPKASTPPTATNDHESLSEAIYQELKQTMGAERERNARESRIVPTIPEDWMARLDRKHIMDEEQLSLHPHDTAQDTAVYS
ncbi:hypothetical protein EC973_008431 [Apophysomyces ossiformis]|uniref:Dilute domain-containing protein n=1 Tax=Apophysomyces ossiformis TaxID=679940 RepID=A0A8H7EPV9_9FUNG|nr:hypothetical protein EC973_008431 [Apophysomyces ossiformis]